MVVFFYIGGIAHVSRVLSHPHETNRVVVGRRPPPSHLPQPADRGVHPMVAVRRMGIGRRRCENWSFRIGSKTYVC